mmetsp:Transcript_16955/g.14849  ORF Transcript_16955/g.14849 Transcript_16955/m.14849 type:complete len:132 (+) Transcript_16955:456-851(+)
MGEVLANTTPNTLVELHLSLENVINTLVVDLVRFVRPIKQGNLDLVRNKLVELPQRHIHPLNISIDWISNEKDEEILTNELLRIKDLKLRKKDKILYLYQNAEESAPTPTYHKDKSQSEDEGIDIPLWFLL